MERLPTYLFLSLALACSGCASATAPSAGGLDSPEPTVTGCAEGCDDGDPCTEDSCVDNACESAPISGCTTQACNSLGLMDGETVVGLGDGESWKVEARAFMYGEATSCTEEPCELDDTCCNTCDTQLGLEVDGENLSMVTTDQDILWGCTVNECGESLGCEPLSTQSNFWLWGRVDDAGETLDYVAQGWCRPTTAETLPGEYIGTWVSQNAEAQTINLTIDHLGGWAITIAGVRECETCLHSLPPQSASSVVIGDGEIHFAVSVCTDGATCDSIARRDVNVSLSSHEDRLIGPFEEANFFEGFGDPYAGAIGLDRLEP